MSPVPKYIVVVLHQGHIYQHSAMVPDRVLGQFLLLVGLDKL